MPKALPASLLVRELSQKDIPSLAELLTAAPDDGTLYGFPNVQQHPQNMLRLHIGWLRQALCDETSLIRIAIIPNEGGNGAKVVGFSSWVRTVVDLNGAGKIRPKHWRQATWMDGMSCLSDNHAVKILYSLQLEEVDHMGVANNLRGLFIPFRS